MPRDGSGVYSRPDPDVITNTTIDSSVYNRFTGDVQAEFNSARPIIAGGTGANNATAARDNLDAEVAGQQVTNYDTHVFEAGSFYSNPGTTSEPISGRYTSGICHKISSAAITLHVAVYDGTTNAILGFYSRVKWLTWGAWTIQGGNNTVADMSFGLNGVSPNSYFYVNPKSDGTGSPNLLQVNRSGTMVAPAKGHVLGNSGGTLSNAAVATTDANVMLYNTSSTNWCGMGTDVSGNFWLRTGTSGTPIPTLAITSANAVKVQSSLSPSTPLDGALVVAGGVGISGNLLVGDAAGALTNEKATIISQSAGGWTLGSNGVDRGFVVNNTEASGYVLFVSQGALANNVGSITYTTTAVAFNTTSDGRLKEDLKAFDNAGNIIDNTTVYDFRWKETGERAVGIIAQQAVEVYDVPMHHNKEQDRWFVDYSKYVPVLLQELKALRARVAELEGRLEAGATPA